VARSNTGGSANYLEFSGTPPVNAVPLSMACWFNVPDVTNYYALVAVLKFANAGTDDYFSIGANGAGAGDPVFAEVANSAAYAGASSGTGYTANTWNHACGVFTANNSRSAYCNGGTVGNNSTNRTPVAGSIDRTQVGSFVAQSGTFSPINGSIAEVGIWNVALTAAEVAELARGYSPALVRPQSLIAYWPLVGGYSPEISLRGGFPLTVNGTMPAAGHCRVFNRAAAWVAVPGASPPPPPPPAVNRVRRAILTAGGR
jgi:hypothetical protein